MILRHPLIIRKKTNLDVIIYKNMRDHDSVNQINGIEPSNLCAVYFASTLPIIVWTVISLYFKTADLLGYKIGKL